ncbi:mitochondrial import inner membrane translocase subunit Tim21-like [Pristis pectinata]|uniref:mitochondrial import inner membrane translocase subunit Tim21-like n=1 Tax=Pristis pectinata TaxID=685728 RepID=UPI00223CD388|nr:mitochondrial import inner membrane translocase subunit Tim21-like [Pristis pectinata]XP_051879447.1 mitochondrial import inner membrane translocase subunit Tim21-like [Pristis pectinata]
MASILLLRAVCTHRLRLGSQFKMQYRLGDSGLLGICDSVSVRAGAVSYLKQQLDSLYCFRSVSSRYIFTETRLRRNNEVPERKQNNKVSLRRSPPPASTAQKVKEAGKDLTYLLVVLVGIGITGGLFYVIFKELFSSSSPSKIYGDALKKCRAHPEIIGVLGEPIKGYGETTRRGRRRHVSHIEYMKDGVKHMQLKFYIEGSEPIKGTVHLDAKENPESGKYDFRYIFVDFDTYPKRTIIVEDNR